ncbi:MAG: alpha/beta hydrolase [Pseudomonadota bacterium]
MPYLSLENHKLFYDLTGPEKGIPILTTHGVGENGSYWGRTGISEDLATLGFHVVDTDMRGHGRSVPIGTQDPGYTVEEVASDFGRIADHLGVERFHILSHATGGMAAIEYVIHNSERVLSLLSTDSSSATFPSDEYSDERYENYKFERQTAPISNPMADARERFPIDETIVHARKQGGGPFFNRLDVNPDAERCWQETLDIMEVTPRAHVVDFMRSFYASADPKINGLRSIQCPVLLLLGEFDEMFIKPNELMARVIPEVSHIVMPGIGHMTAIEDRAGTVSAIVDFLNSYDMLPEL